MLDGTYTIGFKQAGSIIVCLSGVLVFVWNDLKDEIKSGEDRHNLTQELLHDAEGSLREVAAELSKKIDETVDPKIVGLQLADKEIQTNLNEAVKDLNEVETDIDKITKGMDKVAEDVDKVEKVVDKVENTVNTMKDIIIRPAIAPKP